MGPPATPLLTQVLDEIGATTLDEEPSGPGSQAQNAEPRLRQDARGVLRRSSQEWLENFGANDSATGAPAGRDLHRRAGA